MWFLGTGRVIYKSEAETVVKMHRDGRFVVCGRGALVAMHVGALVGVYSNDLAADPIRFEIGEARPFENETSSLRIADGAGAKGGSGAPSSEVRPHELLGRVGAVFDYMLSLPPRGPRVCSLSEQAAATLVLAYFQAQSNEQLAKANEIAEREPPVDTRVR